MAPPPLDRTGGGESTACDTPRSIPTPFLTKTYQLVDDQAMDDIISWNDDGSTFVVWNPTEFARDLLPKYFKHNNFSSFVRQLNTYGFRKVMPDRWEFSNECFRRGEKKLLCDIQRRKIAASSPCTAVPAPRTVSPSDSGEEQVLSSSNSPATGRDFTGGTAELIGENERLRRENSQLNKELSQMKSLCSNIYSLMSSYAGSSTDNQQGSHSCRSYLENIGAKPLDLLPMARFCEEMQINAAANGGDECHNNMRSAAEEISARLFGVPIGVKRMREGSSSEMMDLQLQQPGGEVKPEPMDQDNSGDDQGESWVMRCSSSRNQRVCN